MFLERKNMEDLTQDAAKEKVAEANKKDPDWFCPLINAVCRKDCLCHARGYVSNVTGKPRVVGQYCGNMMFHRECQP